MDLIDQPLLTSTQGNGNNDDDEVKTPKQKMRKELFVDALLIAQIIPAAGGFALNFFNVRDIIPKLDWFTWLGFHVIPIASLAQWIVAFIIFLMYGVKTKKNDAGVDVLAEQPLWHQAIRWSPAFVLTFIFHLIGYTIFFEEYFDKMNIIQGIVYFILFGIAYTEAIWSNALNTRGARTFWLVILTVIGFAVVTLLTN